MADDGGSSYVRVYRLLFETPDCRVMRARLRAAYEALRWEGHEFKLSGTSATCLFTSIPWGTHSNARNHTLGENSNAVSYFDTEFGANYFFEDSEIGAILDKYFGKPTTGPNKVEGAVPTFNVKKDVVRGETDRRKGGVTTKSFRAWVLEQLDLECAEVYKAARHRMEAEKNAILASEDFADRKKEALRELARKDMIDVVRKWLPMGVDFIEETWEQAVVAMVMDR